jgi:hypothetical protein
MTSYKSTDLPITSKLTVLMYIISASVHLYWLHRVCTPDSEVAFGYLALESRLPALRRFYSHWTRQLDWLPLSTTMVLHGSVPCRILHTWLEWPSEWIVDRNLKAHLFCLVLLYKQLFGLRLLRFIVVILHPFCCISNLSLHLWCFFILLQVYVDPTVLNCLSPTATSF